MPSPRTPSRGFTLIELIAVLIVLAIMSVVGAASLSGTARAREAAAARQIRSDLAFARQLAVASGRPAWVTFSTSADTYTLLAQTGTTTGLANAQTLTDPATRSPFVIRLGEGAYAGVDITAASFDGGATVGFDTLGRPISSTATLLAADGSVTLSGGTLITVTARTGAIR